MAAAITSCTTSVRGTTPSTMQPSPTATVHAASAAETATVLNSARHDLQVLRSAGCDASSWQRAFDVTTGVERTNLAAEFQTDADYPDICDSGDIRYIIGDPALTSLTTASTVVGVAFRRHDTSRPGEDSVGVQPLDLARVNGAAAPRLLLEARLAPDGSESSALPVELTMMARGAGWLISKIASAVP
jgi:hypothetical protein